MEQEEKAFLANIFLAVWEIQMPIDSSIATMFANIQIPPARDLPLADLRQMVRANPAAPHREDKLAASEDRWIPAENGDLLIRIYTPEGQGPFPITLFLHSGGFALGDLDSEDSIALALAANIKSVVISVDYRLAPEHPFPAANDDCYTALCWAADHVSDLNGIAGQLSIVGLSAGGILAAATALRSRDNDGPKLAALVNFYGPCTYPFEATPSAIEYADGIVVKAEDGDYFYNLYLQEPALRMHQEASPLHAKDHSGLPPSFIGTAECDPNRDDTEAFAATLEAAGVETNLVRYPGMIHGFLTLQSYHPLARQAVLEIADWLKRKFST